MSDRIARACVYDQYVADRAEAEGVDLTEAERRTLIDLLQPVIGQVEAIADAERTNRSCEGEPMNDRTAEALAQEIARCRKKFPGNRFLLAALVEEVGELAEALFAGSDEEIRKEALQVACVALRIYEEDDATVYTPGLFISLVTGAGRVARALLQRQPIVKALSYVLSVSERMVHEQDPTFCDITDEEAKA
jgi:hypothetical protein